MRGLAALILLTGLTACARAAPRSAALRQCQAPAITKSALQLQIARCSALISGRANADERQAALVARGEAYRHAGQPAAALQDFAQALAARPTDASALDGRGLVRLDQGDLAGARADFEQATQAAPGQSAGFNNLGVALRRQGDLKGALHAENRAIELAPRTPNPWVNRGLVMVSMRRFEMALADFRQAIELNAGLASAYDGVGDADVGKHDVEGAVDAYDRAQTIEFDEGRYDSAIADSDKALLAKPDDPETLNDRCWDRAVANIELDRAMADCQRSLQLRPNAAYVLDSEALVHFRKGEYAQAIAGYDAALAENPKLAPSLFMRGVAKLRAGDREGGQTDIQAAEDMDSSVATEFAAYGLTPS